MFNILLLDSTTQRFHWFEKEEQLFRYIRSIDHVSPAAYCETCCDVYKRILTAEGYQLVNVTGRMVEKLAEMEE